MSTGGRMSMSKHEYFRGEAKRKRFVYFDVLKSGFIIGTPLFLIANINFKGVMLGSL